MDAAEYLVKSARHHDALLFGLFQKSQIDVVEDAERAMGQLQQQCDG